MLTTHTRFSEAMVPAFNRALATPQKPVDSLPTATPALRVDSFEKVKELPPPVAPSVRSGNEWKLPLGAIDWRTIYPEAGEIVRRDILTNFFSQGFRVLAEVSRDSIVKDLEGYLRGYITKPIDRGSVLNGLRKYFPAVERIGIDESNCLSYEHLLLFPLPKPKENKQFPLLFNFAGLSYLGVDSDTIRRLESYRISFLNQPDEQTADLIQPFSELLRESGTKNLENLTLNQIESFVNYCTLGMRVEGAGNSQKEV
jgi:hypothetical protein